MKKIKVATIIGTRPEIIRLAECIRLCDKYFDHRLIHTGQNYDYELNEIFFRDLRLRKPDFFLTVSGKHLGETIGNVIARSYELLASENIEALLILGDTNSVLSAIAAKRLKIPIFHMEAGNRCFDQNVPEEINRKIVDHVADINLTYTEHSRRYLLSEGCRKDHIFVTGSPLREVLSKHNSEIDNSDVLIRLNVKSDNYIVVSAHREENIDLKDHFALLTDALNSIADKYQMPVIFSTHPRTKDRIKIDKVKLHPLINNIPPLGFFDYVKLQQQAYVVLSDSGTISEEAAMMGFAAVSIRTSIERPEAIDAGTIVLGGISKDSIIGAVDMVKKMIIDEHTDLPWEYNIHNTAERVIKIIQGYTQVVNKVIWDK